MIIALIGNDGSGKTTTAKELVKTSKEVGFDVIYKHEYEYVLLGPLLKLTGNKNLEKSRKEMLVERKKSMKFFLWPVLVWLDTLLQFSYFKLFKRNSMVILDRFPYDHYISFGYLGYLTRFTKWLYLHFPRADATILLWVEPEIAYARKKDTHSYAISFYQGQTAEYLELARHLGLEKVNTNNDMRLSLSRIFDILYEEPRLRNTITRKALQNKTFGEAILEKISGNFSHSFDQEFRKRIATFQATVGFVQKLFLQLGISEYAIFKDYGNYQWVGNDVDLIIREEDFDKIHNLLISSHSKVIDRPIEWNRSKSHSKSIDLKAEGLLNIDIHTAIGWRGVDVLKFEDVAPQIRQKAKFGIEYAALSAALDAMIYAYSHVLEKGFLVHLEYMILKDNMASFSNLGISVHEPIKKYLQWLAALPSNRNFPIFIPISIIRSTFNSMKGSDHIFQMQKNLARIVALQIFWRLRFKVRKKLPFAIAQYVENGKIKKKELETTVVSQHPFLPPRLYHAKVSKDTLICITYLILGISIALTWYEPGYYLGRGDNYPKIGASDVFLQQFFLWSEEHIGYFSPNSTTIYVWGIWALVDTIAGISFGQVLFYGLFLAGAMLFNHMLVMHLLKNRLAAVVSSLFYIFNFFIVYSSLTMSVMFAFCFTPLTILLYARIISKIREKASYLRETIIFVLVSSIAIPILYLNPGLLYVVLIIFSSFVVFFTLNAKGMRKKVLINLLCIVSILLPLLSWFAYVNYQYLTSENASFDFVQNEDWSWTHRRLTLENILQLDGAWAFGNNYWEASFVDLYDSPAMQIRSYVPIALVSITIILAIIFRANQFRLLILCGCAIAAIILFLQGATGIIGEIVYSMLPFSFVLREPYTKLMLPLILFMSIVIGYSVRSIWGLMMILSPKLIISGSSFKKELENRANKSLGAPTIGYSVRSIWGLMMILSPKLIISGSSFKKELENRANKIIGAAIIILLTGSILSSGAPLIGKYRLQSMIIPDSADEFNVHVQTPSYWIDAGNWINEQPGDWKVLFLPNNDFYLMPYEWNYYGVDYLPIYVKKQVVSQSYAYLTPPETINSVNTLYTAISQNDTGRFQLLLQLFNIKYLVQRNDIQYEYAENANRPILDPEEVSSFLATQGTIVKVKQFGKLDIYEFKKPFSNNPNVMKLEKIGNMYNFDNSLEGWQRDNEQVQRIELGKESVSGRSLLGQLDARPKDWATITSPLIEPHHNSLYVWKMSVKSEDVHQLQIKIAEYDKNKQLLGIKNLYEISDSTFDWREFLLPYVSDNPNLGFVQLQVKHGLDSNKPLPNKIWIDGIELYEASNVYGDNSSSDMEQQLQQYKVDPSKYVVSFRTQNSSLVILNQAYDPYWRATIGDQQVSSQRVYGLFNGFLIDDAGLKEITIEFAPTNNFLTLFFVSGLLSLTYLSVAIRPHILSATARILMQLSIMFMFSVTIAKNIVEKRFWLVQSSICAIIIISVLVPPFESIGTPIHEYRFDGNTLDYGRDRVDGMNYNATFVQGKTGSGLRFNGINNYVGVNDLPTEELDRHITISAWVLSYTPKGNQHSIIVTKGNDANPTEGYSLRFGYGYDLRFMLGDGKNFVGTDPIIVDKFPTHIVATYDGENAKLYVDGVLKSTQAVHVRSLIAGSQLGIGGNPEAGGKYFEGVIDNVRIYHKALDPVQILLYTP